MNNAMNNAMNNGNTGGYVMRLPKTRNMAAPIKYTGVDWMQVANSVLAVIVTVCICITLGLVANVNANVIDIKNFTQPTPPKSIFIHSPLVGESAGYLGTTGGDTFAQIYLFSNWKNVPGFTGFTLEGDAVRRYTEARLSSEPGLNYARFFMIDNSSYALITVYTNYQARPAVMARANAESAWATNTSDPPPTHLEPGTMERLMFDAGNALEANANEPNAGMAWGGLYMQISNAGVYAAYKAHAAVTKLGYGPTANQTVEANYKAGGVWPVPVDFADNYVQGGPVSWCVECEIELV